MKKSVLIACLFLCVPVFTLAAQLSNESLSGKWMFTHMNMDGSGERKVNIQMEFLSDGVVINYDKAGKEKSRATYKIKDGHILYKDQRGVQKWQVKKFEKDLLHVNHAGVLMYFERL